MSICSAVHAANVQLVKADTPYIKEGDKVMVNDGVNTYYDGTRMASFVTKAVLYVRRIEKNGDVYLVSTEPIKEVYTGRVLAKTVHKI